jgi:hypothetical protein
VVQPRQLGWSKSARARAVIGPGPARDGHGRAHGGTAGVSCQWPHEPQPRSEHRVVYCRPVRTSRSSDELLRALFEFLLSHV